MKGMCRETGTAITDLAKHEYQHLKQSIHDILTTPIGTRICRREYGSLVPDLIDQPANEITQLQIMNASVTALIRFEPRIQVNQVLLSGKASEAGRWTVTVKGTFITVEGEEIFNEDFLMGNAT